MADTNPFPLTELHFNEKRLPVGVKHPVSGCACAIDGRSFVQ